MAVYVDTMKAAFGRMVMCHMIADSREELDAMADAIGVQRKWIQHEGTHLEHYDVSLTKKAAALRHGAVQVSMKELGMKCREKRLRSTRTSIAVARQQSPREPLDADSEDFLAGVSLSELSPMEPIARELLTRMRATRSRTTDEATTDEAARIGETASIASRQHAATDEKD